MNKLRSLLQWQKTQDRTGRYLYFCRRCDWTILTYRNYRPAPCKCQAHLLTAFKGASHG